jgi:hypothetical protein
VSSKTLRAPRPRRWEVPYHRGGVWRAGCEAIAPLAAAMRQDVRQTGAIGGAAQFLVFRPTHRRCPCPERQPEPAPRRARQLSWCPSTLDRTELSQGGNGGRGGSQHAPLLLRSDRSGYCVLGGVAPLKGSILRGEVEHGGDIQGRQKRCELHARTRSGNDRLWEIVTPTVRRLPEHGGISAALQASTRRRDVTPARAA